MLILTTDGTFFVQRRGYGLGLHPRNHRTQIYFFALVEYGRTICPNAWLLCGATSHLPEKLEFFFIKLFNDLI